MLMPEREQTNKLAAAVREARVAKLRQQYQAGTYQVDADKLSAKIIDAHLKLSRTPRETASPNLGGR